MAAVTQPLSLEEFHSRYRHQKPYFEYWFGEPIQKPKATWLHAAVTHLSLPNGAVLALEEIWGQLDEQA